MYGSANCTSCAYGGGGIEGAVTCEAPSGIAVRGGGACSVQPTRDVACWGARWQQPFVLWSADTRARGGRSFIVGAAGVCLCDAFVGVLLVNGTVVVVSGDLVSNATSFVFAEGTQFELIWCGPAYLCARTSSGELVCGTIASGGALPSVVVALPLMIQNDLLTAAVGENHVCTLAANGSVTCFNATGPMLPLPAPPGIFLHIAADGGMTCGIRAADHSVACWDVDGGGTTRLGNSQASMKSVCVGGMGAVCGLAWNPPPGATNDTVYTSTEHEMCWNATTGAMLPGFAGNETFRSMSCSAGGKCGIIGNWSAVCDLASLRPACGTGNAAASAPNSCVGIAAVAVDTGGTPGVGPGDAVEVTLSRAAGQCTNGDDVSDGGTFYSPLQHASGSCPAGRCMAASTLMDGGVTWNAAIAALVYVVGNASGPIGSTSFEVGIDVTHIGALAFIVNASERCAGGNLQGALPVLVTGSWGPQRAPRVINATARNTGAAPGLSARDTLLVTFDSETNRPSHLNASVLSGYLGDVRFAWTDTRTLIITVTHPYAAGATREVQIGILRLIISPGDAILSRDLSSPPSATNVLVNGSWGNAIVGVSSPSIDALTTAGGDVLVVQLAATIGTNAAASDVRVEYSNGQWALAPECNPLPAGDTIRCVTVDGVGRNYGFAVWAYGALIDRGGPNASYASPVVTGISPTLVPTDYTGTLVITGREFGSTSVNAVSNVAFSTARSPAAASEMFRGLACAVNVSHTTITCGLSPLRGSALHIQLNVGGQSTALASMPTLPPILRSVTLSRSATCGGGGSSMCTRGSNTGHAAATAAVLQGDNFGPAGASGLTVTCSPDAAGEAVFTLSGCNVAVAHVTITCDTLPAGYGAPLWFAVAVLGVRSALLNTSIGYAAPSIARVIGAVPTAGAPLSIVGTDFCTQFSTIVRVQLNGGVPFIPDTVRKYPGNTTLDEVVINMPPGVGNHTVVVIVGGWATAPLIIAYARPVVTSAALSAINGLARYRVRITGSNFGTLVADVVVTLGKATCAVVPGLLFDSRLECWTNGTAGNVSIVVAAQTVRVQPFFNCMINEPDPLIWSMAGLGSLPLTGSGILVVSGTVVPAAPSTACVLRIAGGGMAPGRTELCARARALSTTPVCSDWCTAALNVAYDSLQCTTPSAAIASAQLVVVAVALLSCGVSNPFAMLYDAPIVTGITPRLLPTYGGVAMAIDGRNFEANTSFAIAFAAGLAGLSLPALCAPINASRVRVFCSSPPGAGASARLLMSSSTWSAKSWDVTGFGYRAPLIASVSPRLANARGGSVVNITGSDFSAIPRVYLGALLVDIVWQYEHSVVSVVVPPGIGTGINVTLIAVGGQSVVQPRALSYYPPTLTSVDVSYIDAVSGGLLRVLGAQFGPPAAGTGAAAVTVTIEDVVCQNARVLSGGAIECAAPARLVVTDAASVIVTVGQQQSAPTPVRVACRPGYYGAAGERCIICPVGAVCGGFQYDPVPAAGYFRVGRASFVACVPPVACTELVPATVAAALAAGADPATAYFNCAAGATGYLCESCAPQWYRKPGVPECVAYPKYASLYMALFFLFLVAVAAFMFYIHQKHMNLKGITIGTQRCAALQHIANMHLCYLGRCDMQLSTCFSS